MTLPDLFSPLEFRGGVTAKNRVALAPLTNVQSHSDGTLSDAELQWLERRARGGFGIVSTCAAHVAQDGQGFPGQLGIFDERHMAGLSRLAERISMHGALPVVQLYHGGVRAPSRLTGKRPWSASEFTEDTPGFEVPRAATHDDIERVIAQFCAAAERAHRAGFVGVELHGAHGYLLSQFLSRVMNRREDAWGGPLEHRARLLRTITQRIRAALPASFVLGVRLSPEDFGYARGLDLDETVTVARWLAADGVDFLHLSLWQALLPSRKRPDEHPLGLFRAACPSSVKLFAAGHIWTRDEAEQLLVLGADVVALGRSAIVNPDWPHRIVDPAWSPQRPPLSPAELADRGVSPPFVEYLRRFKDFVRDPSEP